MAQRRVTSESESVTDVPSSSLRPRRQNLVASWVVMSVALFFAILAVTLGAAFFGIEHLERVPGGTTPAEARRVVWMLPADTVVGGADSELGS
jgi:hypothetical protein